MKWETAYNTGPMRPKFGLLEVQINSGIYRKRQKTQISNIRKEKGALVQIS